MDKKIVLIAPGGAGKDYLKAQLVDRGFKPSVSYTTRPIRNGEVDGVSYKFVSEDVFEMMIENDEFREYNCFGEQKWYYGTTKRDFVESNLFIMTPSGVSALSKEERDSVTVVYLDIPEDVRYTRLTARNDADTPQRRIDTDRKLFENYSDFDVRITEPLFTVSDIMQQI